MSTRDAQFVRPRWRAFRRGAGPYLVWAVWATMSIGMALFIGRFTHNVPYQDDFVLIPMMTGHENVSLRWAWAQHNEHRPLVPRLILAGLSRFVVNDFRTGKYFNVALLSAGAAGMLLTARTLRGYTSISDAVLPLSVLTLGQLDTLLITFAMNLVLTATVCFGLIAILSLARGRRDWVAVLISGSLLVLLPLTSGIVMLPPLLLWLTVYVACDWWSGQKLSRAARSVGLLLLMIGSAIVALFFSGYASPAYHPRPPSVGAIGLTMLEYFSLAVAPNMLQYWQVPGVFVVLLVAATLVLLSIVAFRVPEKRASSSGMIAMLLAMCCAAGAVGLCRSGLGPDMGRSGRYVTLTAPLLALVYFAWLAYGGLRLRRGVHAVLFVLVCLAFPQNLIYGLRDGRAAGNAERRVELNLATRMPAADVVRHAASRLYPEPSAVHDGFAMLKRAGFGAFKDFNDDRLAADADRPSEVRR